MVFLRVLVYVLLILEATGVPLERTSRSTSVLSLMPRQRSRPTSDEDEVSPATQRRRTKTRHEAQARAARSQEAAADERQRNAIAHAAARTALSQDHPERAAEIQFRDTTAHQAHREDAHYRAAEQARNTAAHQVHREDALYRAAEQARDAAAHQVYRANPGLRAAENNRRSTRRRQQREIRDSQRQQLSQQLHAREYGQLSLAEQQQVQRQLAEEGRANMTQEQIDTHAQMRARRNERRQVARATELHNPIIAHPDELPFIELVHRHRRNLTQEAAQARYNQMTPEEQAQHDNARELRRSRRRANRQNPEVRAMAIATVTREERRQTAERRAEAANQRCIRRENIQANRDARFANDHSIFR